MSFEGPGERKSPEALVEELKSLVAANVAGNVQLLSRVGALLGDATRAAAAREPGQIPDPSAMLTQLLESALASYALVNTHTLALLNGLVAVAERAVAAPVPTRATPDLGAPAQPAGEMNVTGSVGESVTGSFAVDNQYDSPIQVSFHVGPLTASHGSMLPSSHVTLDPVRLVVGPRSQAIVKATVDITDDFASGETYTTNIRVLGFQAPDVVLRISVPAGADTNQSTDPVRRHSGRRKRRSA